MLTESQDIAKEAWTILVFRKKRATRLINLIAVPIPLLIRLEKEAIADFVYGMLAPMLRLTCIHKGRGSDASRMVTNCYAVPKIRIGARTGLFADVTLIPQIGDYADAMGMVEFGYKW